MYTVPCEAIFNQHDERLSQCPGGRGPGRAGSGRSIVLEPRARLRAAATRTADDLLARSPRTWAKPTR